MENKKQKHNSLSERVPAVIFVALLLATFIATLSEIYSETSSNRGYTIIEFTLIAGLIILFTLLLIIIGFQIVILKDNLDTSNKMSSIHPNNGIMKVIDAETGDIISEGKFKNHEDMLKSLRNTMFNYSQNRGISGGVFMGLTKKLEDMTKGELETELEKAKSVQDFEKCVKIRDLIANKK